MIKKIGRTRNLHNLLPSVSPLPPPFPFFFSFINRFPLFASSAPKRPTNFKRKPTIRIWKWPQIRFIPPSFPPPSLFSQISDQCCSPSVCHTTRKTDARRRRPSRFWSCSPRSFSLSPFSPPFFSLERVVGILSWVRRRWNSQDNRKAARLVAAIPVRPPYTFLSPSSAFGGNGRHARR